MLINQIRLKKKKDYNHLNDREQLPRHYQFILTKHSLKTDRSTVTRLWTAYCRVTSLFPVTSKRQLELLGVSALKFGNKREMLLTFVFGKIGIKYQFMGETGDYYSLKGSYYSGITRLSYGENICVFGQSDFGHVEALWLPNQSVRRIQSAVCRSNQDEAHFQESKKSHSWCVFSNFRDSVTNLQFLYASQHRLACSKTSDWQLLIPPFHFNLSIMTHHSALTTLSSLAQTFRVLQPFPKKQNKKKQNPPKSSMFFCDFETKNRRGKKERNTFHIPSRYWNNFPGEAFVDTSKKK